MKILFILCGLVLFASTARSQSLSINGRAFALGEPETKARADIGTAGFELVKFAENRFGLTSKQPDASYELFGDITFKDGRVSAVERNWILNSMPADAQTILNIFHGALSSVLEGSTEGQCEVTVKTEDHSPSAGVTRTSLIKCAKENYMHEVILTATDCTTGCSIGSISPTIDEVILQKGN